MLVWRLAAGDLCSDTSLPIFRRDTALRGDNNGVRCLLDAASTYCYPSQAAPTNGALLKDLSELSPDSAFRLGLGKTVGYSGGGFDFSTYANASGGTGFQPCYAEIPGTFASSIWGTGSGATATASISGGSVSNTVSVTAGGSDYVAGRAQVLFIGGGGTGAAGTAQVVNGAVVGITVTNGGTGYTSAPTVVIVPSPQYFFIIFYVKLPSLADWNATTQLFPMLQFANGSGGYTGEADLITVGQAPSTTPGQLTFRRQTNGLSAADAVSVTPLPGHYNNIVQIGVGRTATNQFMRVTGMNGVSVIGTAATGLPNTGNVSGKTGKFGVGPGLTGPAATNAVRYKGYRIICENPIISGRLPDTVMNDDLTVFAARVAQGVFS